jgi:hypothetical protein
VDHEPVVERGELRIDPPGGVAGLVDASRSTAGPSLVIARLGWITVPEDQFDGVSPT